MDYLASNIIDVIHHFDHGIYLINLNHDVMCKCVDYDTKQAKDNCPLCLGTGFQIMIRKAKGAFVETNMPATYSSTNAQSTSLRSYYIEIKYPFKEYDMIVDGQMAYNVYDTQLFCSFGGVPTYKKAICNEKKFNTNEFMVNFQKIIRG